MKITLIVKFLNHKKATGPDCIPIKVIKTAANVSDSHLAKGRLSGLRQFLTIECPLNMMKNGDFFAACNVNYSFPIKPFFYITKKPGQKIKKISRTERALNMK